MRRIGLFSAVAIVAMCAAAIPMVRPASAQEKPKVEAAPPTLTDLDRAQLTVEDVRHNYAQLLTAYTGCEARLGATAEEFGRQLKDLSNQLGQLQAQAATNELTGSGKSVADGITGRHPGFVYNPDTRALEPKPAPASTTPPGRGGRGGQ